MNKKALLFSVSAVLAVSLVLASQVGCGSKMEYASKADIDYSQDLWKALKAAKVVGNNLAKGELVKGAKPHGSFVEAFTGTLNVKGHTGKVIFLYNWMDPSEAKAKITPEKIEKDRTEKKKLLYSIAVMFQREKGYDDVRGNWFWVKFKNDGTLHRDSGGNKMAGKLSVVNGKVKEKSCVGCHLKAPEKDFIYSDKMTDLGELKAKADDKKEEKKDDKKAGKKKK